MIELTLFGGETFRLHYNQILATQKNDGPGTWVHTYTSRPVLVKERIEGIDALCMQAGELSRERAMKAIGK